MQAVKQIAKFPSQHKDRNIIPGLLLMAVALVVGIILALISTDSFSSYPYLYIFPWICGLAVVILFPFFVLYYRGKFSFADPLVLATCSYFFPAFVIGGILLATGLSSPYFLSFVQDPKENFPYTIQLIGLGFIGLSLGYLLPPGAYLGRLIEKHLPTTDHEPSSYVTPGILLLGLGFINSIFAFAFGLLGYQTPEEISIFDGSLYLTTLFWLQGSFLLCLVLFRQRNLGLNNLPVILVLTATSIIKIIFAGNRGTIIQIFTIVFVAFILSGRSFRFKQGVFAGTILTIGLIGGMIYGTTFRNVKGSESNVDLGSYTESISTTFDQLGQNASISSIEFGLMTLAERVDALSSVAVVVSSYEQLAPYEESYGLDNNILKDLVTFFIPRILWNDKPSASQPRKYSDLYFNYSENSFTITPIGDLLRNFGVPGIFLGMLLMGFILKVIYRSLVEDQQPVTWRLVLYFMLLTSINYETFYGSFIPMLFKVGIVSLVGILMVFFVRNMFSSAKKVKFL